MKKFFRAVVCLLGTLLFAFSSVAAQAKKPEDTFVVRDGSWQLKSGGEPQGTRGASFAKKMWWYAIDPKTDSAAKGLTRGVLLYDARADSSKAYSFLPTAEEQAWVEQITFSPDRKKMVMACRLNRFASGLYVYDVASLTLEKTFWGYSEVWFVDNARFVFTLIDRNRERPEAAGMWATSAALYDPSVADGYSLLRAASATESFAVMEANAREVTLAVTSVAAEKDWHDVEKHQDSFTTVPLLTGMSAKP